ncbi:MAG: sulfatase-like hydrolase/transferase [Faecalibacterium sp.]
MKRNVVVILCDQLRRDFLSCYGFAALQTTNIDALAAQGVRFDGATTASPVCAPARASMMTGRYVSDHGVWTNDVPFRDGIDFLPQRMNAAGYRTGAFGKLHHFPGRDGKGFSVCKLMEENRLNEADDYFQWLKEKHPEIENVFPHLENGDFAFSRQEYYEQWIADNAIGFVKENAEHPFFAWVSFQGPHTPMDPPHDVSVALDEDKIPAAKAVRFRSGCEVPDYRGVANYGGMSDAARADYRVRYCKMIGEIDRQIGRLVQTLKAAGVYENTTILFSADHGDMCGDYGMMQKGPMPYAAQFEVPMILANCPNVVQGSESSMPVSNLDIGATCLSIAGDEAPFGVSRPLHKMLAGTVPPHKAVFAEFCDSIKLLDTARYRFAYYPFTGQSQLFDKTLPDYELHNLANDPAHAVLKATLLMELMDYTILAKGARIEAQDFVPKVQEGLREKMPNFAAELPLVFPLQTEAHRERLRKEGYNADYNEFCKEHEILRHYGAYWLPKGVEKHQD